MGPWIPLLVACACLGSCGDAKLECGADEVVGTLSSMVRDRVLRVTADAYPSSFDAAKKRALTKATRITPRDTQLLDWDKAAGRLACVAQVVIDAPRPERDTTLRSVALIRYRVTRYDDEVFFVEVAYADLFNVFPSPAGPTRDVRPAPVRPPR
jgi:hypothetical protein